MARSVAWMSAGSPGQRHPAKRPLALAEQRPDVGGDESGIGERVAVAVLLGQAAQRVAVVKRLRSRLLQRADRAHVRHGALPHPPDVVVGIGAAQRLRLLHRQPGGHVAVQRIVGAGLVGDDVDLDAAAHQLGQDLGGVAGQADRQRPALGARGVEPGQRVVEVAGALVQVPGLDAPLDPVQVDLDAQRGAAEHGDRQRLGAAHPAEARGHHQPARPGCRPKRLRAAAAKVS